jgi:hypothetical protein
VNFDPLFIFHENRQILNVPESLNLIHTDVLTDIQQEGNFHDTYSEDTVSSISRIGWVSGAPELAGPRLPEVPGVPGTATKETQGVQNFVTCPSNPWLRKANEI